MSRARAWFASAGALVMGCGGAAALPSDGRDAVRTAALAPVLVTEPAGPLITSTTLDETGRATPYGVSGIDPVAYLDGPTLDPTYGFTPENPARVGGSASGSPESGESSFLTSLYGPQGQPLYFQRIGAVHGADGILDAFAITYEGLGDDALILYLDPYRLEPLHVPVGLTGLGATTP